MQKNDLFEIEITDMGVDGEGIGRYEGMTFFIKDALIGDRIIARATKLKKNYGYARVEEIVVPSTFRVTPECPLHRQCGGCQIQALSYGKQLEFKANKVRANLVRIGGFEESLIDGIMEPPVGMESPYRYRNKAQFPVGKDREGRIVTGFYAARTHNIIPVEDCLLGVKENRQILEMIKEWMKNRGIGPYEEKTGKGLVRHILIRYGFTTKEIMVCLIINGKKLPHGDSLCGALAQIPGMTSVSYNINTENTNVILGKETVCIWGQPYITDYIHLRKCGPGTAENAAEYSTKHLQPEAAHETKPETASEIKPETASETEPEAASETEPEFALTDTAIAYRISPQSFYQVNPVQTEKLYSTALEYAGLTGKEYVWDLYCGIGTISLFLSQRAKQVYGVEIIPQAIEDAKNNARLNGITNAEFFVGKAEEVLPEFYERMSRGKAQDGNRDGSDNTGDLSRGYSAGMLRPDVIVVDPPRKGCDEKCLETMLKMRPERIVYVSCDSATLARDLRILCDGGYELKRIRAFDQFSHTMHVETVVGLQRIDT